MTEQMERPKVIKLAEKEYFDATELKTYDPIYFTGTSRTVRLIVTKKEIPLDQYCYASLSKLKGWTMSNQKAPSSKATLLLLKDWVLKNIPKMKPDSDESKEAVYEYPEAPQILYLGEEEKFKDSAGNTANIETRGGRSPDKIYFLAKDVADVFEMPDLIRTLKRKETKYIENIHYVIYTSNVDAIHINEKMKPKKQTFITYRGMLKILFGSLSGRADKFVDWATNILFIHQMGSEEMKEELGSELIGQPVKSVRAVFKTFAKKVPCVYRFALGTAKNLREVMNLPDTIHDDFVIIKYGLTEDLDRRMSEHIRTYEKIKGVRLGLMNFSYIDPKFLSQAEVDVKEFFQDIEIPIKYESFAELVAINPKHEKQINKQFAYIGSEFSGSITELIVQIEKLKSEIEMLKKTHEWELKDKDRIIEQKDLIIQNKDLIIQSKDKDIEILNLKLEITSTFKKC